MEHIPRAQPRSCLYVLSLCLQLPVAISTYTEDTRSILQEKKSSAVVVILQQLCVFYLLPILDTFD